MSNRIEKKENQKLNFSSPIKLGVNIDHVATIRNARGGDHPDPLRAAVIAASAGADGITVHLREDRRHISDKDVFRIKNEISLPLNLEMAPTEEMLEFAELCIPNSVCLVPEKRQEKTTEGGLNICESKAQLFDYISRLKRKGIGVSLFIEPHEEQVEASFEVGADIVELHTGKYANSFGVFIEKELKKINLAAFHALDVGLECHAGHGLNYSNVEKIASMHQITELNIGHFIIGESIFCGLYNSISRMREIIDLARKNQSQKKS